MLSAVPGSTLRIVPAKLRNALWLLTRFPQPELR